MTEIKAGQVYLDCSNKYDGPSATVIFVDEKSVLYELSTNARYCASPDIFLQYYKLKKEKVKAQTKFIPVGYRQYDVSKSPVIMNWFWSGIKKSALDYWHEGYIVIDAIEVKWEGEVP